MSEEFATSRSYVEYLILAADAQPSEFNLDGLTAALLGRFGYPLEQTIPEDGFWSVAERFEDQAARDLRKLEGLDD